jgi:hypothetical protein
VKNVAGKGPYWKPFSGRVADSDDAREVLFQGLRHVSGTLTGNIHADFVHDLDCERVRLGRLDSRAHGDKFVTGERAKKPFGHLASCGIAG